MLMLRPRLTVPPERLFVATCLDFLRWRGKRERKRRIKLALTLHCHGSVIGADWRGSRQDFSVDELRLVIATFVFTLQHQRGGDGLGFGVGSSRRRRPPPTTVGWRRRAIGESASGSRRGSSVNLALKLAQGEGRPDETRLLVRPFSQCTVDIMGLLIHLRNVLGERKK